MALFEVGTESSGKAPSKAVLLEEGGYPARIVSIVDVGKQPGSEQYPDPSYKMNVTFELLDEYMTEVNEDGSLVMMQDPDGEPGEMIPKPIMDKPRWFDVDFSYNPDGYVGENSNLHKLMKAIGAFAAPANLEQGIEARPAKPLKEWLGEALTVGIIRHTKTKGKKAGEIDNRISSYTAMKSKEKKDARALINPTRFFNLGDPDIAVFNNLPKSDSPFALKNRITANLEFTGSKLHSLITGVDQSAAAAPAAPVNAATEAQVDEAMKAELEAQAAQREAQAAAAATGGEGDTAPVIPF